MNTWRASILTAVVNALGMSTPVYRSRVEALNRAELPAIVVKPGAEIVESIARGVARRDFEIRIEVHGRGTPADAVVDPVLAAVHQALMADMTLGNRIARLIERETEAPDFADGDDTAVAVTAVYVATYLTPAADNTRLAT